MVSKHVTNFCKGIIVTLTLNLSLTLQTWHSLHVDKKCSWLGPSGGGSGYIVHVRGGDCFVLFHSSYWGKHFARLFVTPYFFVRLLSANTSFKSCHLILHGEMLISRKYPYLPKALLFRRPNPMYLSLPIAPGISMIFPLGWISPGKNISVKNADALYFNLYHLLPLGYRRLLDPLPPSPQNILCPLLACMYIFWNYTILGIVSKPRASPILWRFRFSYHS